MEVGRVADAIQLLEHVDRLSTETLGEGHPRQISTRKCLNEAYRLRDNGSLGGGQESSGSSSSKSESKSQCNCSSISHATLEAFEQADNDPKEDKETKENGGEVQNTQAILTDPDGGASQHQASPSHDLELDFARWLRFSRGNIKLKAL